MSEEQTSILDRLVDLKHTVTVLEEENELKTNQLIRARKRNRQLVYHNRALCILDFILIVLMLINRL